jgi:PE family
MSFVTTQPAVLASAAAELQTIGSAMAAGNTAAAVPTTGVVPAAADEVSALTAAQFAAHAQLYQALGAQATAINEMFVNALATSAGSYAVTEVANAAAAAAAL